MKKIMMILAVCLLSGNAFASDYGCKVLFCLANPAGPEAVSECVPPIERLYSDLADGDPFPTCEEMGNNGSGSSGANQFASPSYCHPDLITYGGNIMGGNYFTCRATGAITITKNGQTQMRYWWNMNRGPSLMETTLSTPNNLHPAPLVDPSNAVNEYLIAHHCNGSNNLFGFNGGLTMGGYGHSSACP